MAGVLRRIWNKEADESWLETKDAGFERWVAQQGTQFLPSNTGGWPSAGVSDGLYEAIAAYGIGPGSYSAIYRSQPSVYTVVEFLSWQISQIGLKVYARLSDTEREHLQDSPITQTLLRPASGLTYERFIHGTVADLCIYGNAYWLKLQQGTERILVPLTAWKVTPRGGTLVSADVYTVNIAGVPRDFPAESVVHFRRYNPDDRRIGVSPLEPLRSIIAEESEASKHREGFWRNGMRPDAALVRKVDEPPLSDNARKRMREDLQNTYSGPKNAGKWMILEDGFEPRPLSFSPKDSEFIEGRKLTLETVARAFNIPLSVLGLTDTATYASQKEFHKALYQDTLGPWLKMLEGEIQAAVIPWFTADPNVYVEFNIEEKMRGAFEEQADILLKAVGGPYMTRNEGRARLNLPRIDDPDADELVVTNNMVGTEADAQAAPVVQLAPTQEAKTS